MTARPNPRIAKVLRALRKRKGPPLLAFDFDGTLVGFREDPAAVRLGKEQTALLRRLARYYPVAVISGRSLADLKARLRGLPFHLAGNHGFEIEVLDGDRISRPRAEWAKGTRAWIRALRAEIRKRPELRGVIIEDKHHSLSVHFRSARDPERVEKILREWADAAAPEPRVVRGVLVMNLVPRDAAHKGTALKNLLRVTGCPSALFAGDDTTDEDVFKLGLKNVVGVKIGSRPKKTAARFRLESRAELRELIRSLIAEARLRV